MFTRNDADEPLASPVIMLRVMVAAVIFLLCLSQFVLKASPLHDMFEGGALGLMVGVFFLSFEVRTVEFKDRKLPSAVRDYKLR